MLQDNREMHAITSSAIAWAKDLQVQLEIVYESSDPEFAFWCMLDLRASASYRQMSGSRSAYIRGETFRSLLSYLCEQHGTVDLFKELGDGFLIRSLSLRPLLEIISMADSVARGWDGLDPRPGSPSLDFSAAITAGSCVRLRRESSADYLGQPLDQLARVASYRPPDEEDLIVLADGVLEHAADALRDLPFLTAQVSQLLPRDLQKPGETPIRIAVIKIDRAKFSGYRTYFAAFRSVF